MSFEEMKPERQMAVRAMQNMGWTAERTKRGKTVIWKFSRPDTGGLWDICNCRQDQLSMAFVAETAMSCGDAPDLVRTISKEKERWLKARFLGLYSVREVPEAEE